MIVRTHLIPGWEKTPLVKFTPQKLQALLNERHASGLSATTVKHINATFRAVFSEAQRWQLVHQNVAKLVTLPRATRYEASILTPVQAKAFLTYLIRHRHEALFSVALTIELGRGEILALRWRHLDLEKTQLLNGEELKISEPKSMKARRATFRTPHTCLTSLIAHKRVQENQRLWA